MALPRRRLRPQDYARCTKCGRLTEKAALVPFNGGFYGPDCLQAAKDAALVDPFAPTPRVVVRPRE